MSQQLLEDVINLSHFMNAKNQDLNDDVYGWGFGLFWKGSN
jgi:hypothetical protein